MRTPALANLIETIAIKKATDSIGKQSADPIDANFLSGIVLPLGRVALVERHANTCFLNLGTDASIRHTRPEETRSLASDISRVARLLSMEEESASLAFTS
jgi:hypothetical protein